MDGGLVVLGVADDGTVTGVVSEAVDRLTAEVANLSNNPSKLDPPSLLFPQAEAIDGKTVVHVHPNDAGYEVEFMTLNGRTIAVVTVMARQIRAVTRRDIVHVRELAVA